MGSPANTQLPITTTLITHIENGIPFYRFQRFREFPELDHAIFTRLAGVSSSPFASLNVSYDTGDDVDKVKENLRRVRTTAGSPSLIYARQSHSSNLMVLHQHPSVDPSVLYPLQGFDGFITQLPGFHMMIKIADCQAVFLYDPKERVVAAIHVGWRGSAQNILGKAVHLMATHFRCRPKEVIAAIGPSLGPCCAEFQNWKRELPTSLSRFQLDENYFDFWAISQSQLQEAGLTEKNIEVAGLCTKCHPEVFYSYRGEKETGRFGATIGMRG